MANRGLETAVANRGLETTVANRGLETTVANRLFSQTFYRYLVWESDKFPPDNVLTYPLFCSSLSLSHAKSILSFAALLLCF